MRKLRIGIIDLLTKKSTRALWSRVMGANFASIMPQVIATWCEQAGHEVNLICYTGIEDLVKEISDKVDIVFIGAFTQSALLAYALSNRFRANGAVTVLGGPHARCYPQDAQKYFDYVLGFTDKGIIQEVLQDCAQHRPLGQYLSAEHQPTSLPGARERWKFIKQTHKKTPFLKIIPMISSMGCPYTCNFCIDSNIAYQTLDYETIREDLRFLLKKYKRPLVGWHDPTFGVKFNEIMETIEAAVPPNSIDFAGETSLSILSQKNLVRLKKNGFKAVLPGIESWYEVGNKSKTGKRQGEEKVKKAALKAAFYLLVK